MKNTKRQIIFMQLMYTIKVSPYQAEAYHFDSLQSVCLYASQTPPSAPEVSYWWLYRISQEINNSMQHKYK